MQLKKSNCAVVMANLLFQVFKENGNDFPLSFDDFGKQLSDKFYKNIKLLEGNALTFGRKKELVYDTYCSCVSQPEQSILEMNTEIELVDDVESEKPLTPGQVDALGQNLNIQMEFN